MEECILASLLAGKPCTPPSVRWCSAWNPPCSTANLLRPNHIVLPQMWQEPWTLCLIAIVLQKTVSGSVYSNWTFPSSLHHAVAFRERVQDDIMWNCLSKDTLPLPIVADDVSCSSLPTFRSNSLNGSRNTSSADVIPLRVPGGLFTSGFQDITPRAFCSSC